jgi:hypothetical protein
MNALCVIAACGVGVFWGPIGIAAAYAIVSYGIVLPSLWYSFKDTPVSIPLFLEAIARPMVSSLVTGLLLILFQLETSFLKDSTEILISFFLAIVAYCGMWLLLPGGKQQLLEYFSYLPAMVKLSPPFAKKNVEGRIS